jgi:hypothetical protein
MVMFVLETLEIYSHSLIQSTSPSLLLVEYSRKENVLDSFLISVYFIVVLYSKGVHGSETDGMMTQSQKKCIKDDKQSFIFDEDLFNGERESSFH